MIRNGVKTSQADIDEMKRLWLQGLPATQIAATLGANDRTVRRYCEDIPRPKVGRLSNLERAKLLRKWHELLRKWHENTAFE